MQAAALQAAFVGVLFFFGAVVEAAEPVEVPDPEAFRIVKRNSRDFRAIKGVFDSIIRAAKKGRADDIVAFFSERYLNSGRNRDDVRRQWKQILENFSDLELQHPIYHIERSGRFAKMKCEGVLMGKPRKPMRRETGDDLVVIDSWKFSVHYLVFEDGGWKILGDQIPYDTGRTFHPLF